MLRSSLCLTRCARTRRARSAAVCARVRTYAMCVCYARKRSHLRLGLASRPCQLDDDKGGSLDLTEIKPMLKKLIDAATANESEVKELSVSTKKARKEAARLQKELAAAAAKEEKEAKEAEEKAAAEEEAKKAAEAEAKAAKAAEKAAKAAEKAAEKAAYDAKIEERRKAKS